MFFTVSFDKRTGDRYICDTSDGVIEKVTPQQYLEYKNTGITIYDTLPNNEEGIVTDRDISRCTYNLYNRIRRANNDQDVIDYIRSHIQWQLYFFGCQPLFEPIKIYDYCETNNFAVVAVETGSGTIVYVLFPSGANLTYVNGHVKVYPCLSGEYVARFAAKVGLEYGYIDSRSIYMIVYDAGVIHLINLLDFSYNTDIQNPDNKILQ